jgi:cytochrome c-type biogenesis protein CcmF
MFLGFAGSAYKQDTELALHPGETTVFRGYSITYVRPERTPPHDKQFEVRAEFRITRGGKPVATLFPKKTIFEKSGGMPTTDPAISTGLVDDVYLALGTVDATSKLATVHVFVNPLTGWIWVGVLILLLGASITAWPQPLNLRPTTVLRFAFAVFIMVVVGFQIASLPARAIHLPGFL